MPKSPKKLVIKRTSAFSSSSASPSPVLAKVHSAGRYDGREVKLDWNAKHYALLSLWCLLVFGSLTLYIVADVFQNDTPEFPLFPTIVIAVALGSMTSTVCAITGKTLYTNGSFELYQPFSGGNLFVVMQALGYFLVVTAGVAAGGYGVLAQTHPRHGVLAIAGATTVVGNLTLLISIFVFDPNHSKRTVASSLGWMLSRVRESPNRETMLTAVFLVAQLGLCILSEWMPPVASVLAFVVGMFQVLSGVLIHFVIGHRYTPRYRLFMPYPGTMLQATAQGCAWLVYFTALYGAAILCFVGEHAPALSHIALASGCFISTVGLILFTRLAHFNMSEETTHSYFASCGCAVFTGASALQASAVLLLTALFMLRPPSESWKRGLLFCQTISSFFLLLIPPCTHTLGRIVHGKPYVLFQPFRGGVDFVMLQAAGWACFGCALLFQTLHLTANDYQWVFVEAVSALAAQVFIHSSLRTFRATPFEEPVSVLNERIPESIQTLLTFVNGELVTAFLFMSSALVLRIIVDVSATFQGSKMIPKEILLLIATVLFACATPLAHFSGRRHGIPLFRPFAGSGMYIALQSIGWTIYAAFLLVTLFSWITYTPTHLDVVHATMVSGVPFLLATSYGVAQYIPLLLVSVSVIVEALHETTSRADRQDVVEALDSLSLVHEHLLMRKKSLESGEASVDQLLEAIERIRCAGDRIHPSLGSEASQSMSSDSFGAHRERLGSPARHHRGDSQNQHYAATLIILLMSFASVSCYITGSFWTGSLPIFGIGFATAGLAIVTTSCVALHSAYGSYLHGSCNRYTFFMPFVGGTEFVAYQAAGWISYTACAVLTIACAIERRGNVIALLLAGVFSVTAQFCVLISVPKFDPTPQPKTFLQSNSAALVAAFTFLASFVFSHLYGRFRDQTFSETSPSSSGVASLGNNDSTELIPKGQMVPLVVSAVSMTFAIPLTFVALRSRMGHRLDGMSGSDTSDPGTNRLSRWPKRARDVLVALDSVVFALSLSIPAVIVYLAYYLFYNLAPGFSNIAHGWGYTMLTLGTLLVVSLSPAAFANDVQLPPRVRRYREAFVAFQVYLIPTHASLLSYSMPLIFPGSIAAVYFAVAMSLLTLGAHVKLVRQVVLKGSYVLLGYTTYQHCHACWFDRKVSVFLVVVDVALFIFWVRYERLFRNKPQETGVLRSEAFIRFMKKYLIPDVERYFNIKLVVHSDKDGNRTSLRDAQNKYIFSYHPHGIFPGTALLLPLTSQWEYQVGVNPLHHVSTHAAGIIFNVPMVRDFLLRLGGRVVTRNAIDCSLNEGNSVMIVTGGQAEMLHTKYSSREMHLVAHHVGFLRLAVKHQVPVVPLVSFAENNVMDNVHFPWIQKKMLKLIGFPFPTIPHGRWYLPLPNRTPLSVVVGTPVNPPDGLTVDDEEGIKRFSVQYFSEVKNLFYKYRAECGYPDMELVLHTRDGR